MRRGKRKEKRAREGSEEMWVVTAMVQEGGKGGERGREREKYTPRAFVAMHFGLKRRCGVLAALNSISAITFGNFRIYSCYFGRFYGSANSYLLK